MNVIAINGSPRKNKNTAMLLDKALEGAASAGAATERIDLYDHNYTGCRSCFACKLIGGKSYGKCSIEDGIKPILDKINDVDGIILGSPIYLGSITGQMKSFLERLIFPYLVYDENRSSLFTKRIPVRVIYTAGVTESKLQKTGWMEALKYNEFLLNHFIGDTKALHVTDTYQFEDYSRYVSSAFNAEEKLRRRNEVFPEDCRRAYELGSRMLQRKDENRK